MYEKQPKFNKRKIKNIYIHKLGFKFHRHGKYKSVPGSVCFKMGDREMAFVPRGSPILFS